MSDTIVEQRPANPKAGQWAERIAAQQRAGISVKQFCKEPGLTEYSFYAWRKGLQQTRPVRFALVDRNPRRQERAVGPAKFLEGYKGYLQADAYSVYDAFFKSERGMTEVGCWMHARRYVFKALESDEAHMGPALHLIARLYAVEERAKALSLSAEQRLALRQRVSARLIGKLHQYLLDLQPQVLPKSPSGAAVRYALNQWEALTRFLEDGELEIDNGATERANRDIAVGRGNWTFFGSDSGGKTAAVLPRSEE